MFEKIRVRLTFWLSTLALFNASAFSAFLMSQPELEEVVVTARKKTESLQDVPIQVSALRESSLEEKGINVFEDYLLQLPTVTAGGAGPGARRAGRRRVARAVRLERRERRPPHETRTLSSFPLLLFSSRLFLL